MRYTQVPLEEVLPHEAPVLERRADLARERLPALVARLVPLALVLAQELHPAVGTRTTIHQLYRSAKAEDVPVLARPWSVLDMRANVHEDVVPSLVALTAPNNIAPIVVQELAPRAEPPCERLQERLVQLRVRMLCTVLRRALPELLELNPDVRVEHGFRPVDHRSVHLPAKCRLEPVYVGGLEVRHCTLEAFGVVWRRGGATPPRRTGEGGEFV